MGVIAIMKNETTVLREWLDHYRWQGVDKVFLIDNGSSDNPLSILQNEIHSGFVEFFSRTAPHRQDSHYQDVFKCAKIRLKVEWLIMADLDEYWFSPLGDLKKAIAAIESNFDLVYANWVLFGSSGHVKQPPSVREGFVHRWQELGGHPSTKWVCRTCRIRSRKNISMHKVGGIDSRRVISDNVAFHLNHYPIMSREYFQNVKMTRGSADNKIFDSLRTIDYFEAYDKPATIKETLLADMVRKAG